MVGSVGTGGGKKSVHMTVEANESIEEADVGVECVGPEDGSCAGEGAQRIRN